MTNLPVKIEVCPIVDSVVELRFEPSTYPNAVFGLVYNALEGEFQKVEKLPILQIPEQFREADENFTFKPQYRLVDDNFTIQVGPKVIGISSKLPYTGWDQFSTKIFNVFSKLFQSKICKTSLKLGVRYTNFFEEEIFSNINLDINISDEQIKYKNTLLRTEINKQGYTNILQVSNNAEQKIENEVKTGSILDIDTQLNLANYDFQSNYKELINNGHQIEKDLFFSLLREEFLKKLKPIYHDQ